MYFDPQQDEQDERAQEARYIESLHRALAQAEQARDELLNTLRALALEEQAQPESTHRTHALQRISATLEALS